MGGVVTLGLEPPESVTDFIRREGTVRTTQVAMRFGWDMRRARAELKALVKAGQVAKAGRFAVEYGAENEWRAVAGA